ncbi:MAG: EAL domain-containing protein [Pseudomonadota bacterium]
MPDSTALSIAANPYRRAAALLGAAIAGCGVAALLGWQLDIIAFQRFHPAWLPIQPLAALCLALSGMALYLQSRDAPPRHAVPLARAGALATMALAVAALSARQLGWPAGIDYLWFSKVGAPALSLSGACEFALLGLALALLDATWRGGLRPAQWIAWLLGLQAMFVVIDSFFGGNSMQTFAPDAAGMLHTPALVCLMAAGALLARPDQGLVRALTSNRPSGKMARIMLPGVVLIPIVDGWLGLVGEQDGIFTNEFGDALFTMLEVATLTGLTFWTGNRHLRLELEREKIGSHLVESEMRFRQLAENISEMFFLTERSTGHMLYVSPAYEEIWQRSCHSLYAAPDSWLEAIHPDDLAAAQAARHEGERSGRFDYACRVLRPDGSQRWVRTRGFPIRDIHGTLIRIAGVAQDITAHTEQAQRIARLSRLYAVLSAINSAIVRIHDRQELFQEACRVAVKDGAFGMAWVSAIVPDTLEGHIVACYGGAPGYIEKTRVSAGAGRPFSDRPASVAVREMRPVVCNDIETVASLAPLRDELLARGHRSLAALPIILDGKAVAVLALYAADKDFFDEQEMNLLNELAGDLGFALQYISKEEQLHYLAYYDALTGLANASLFQDRLAQILHGAKADAPMTAVILLNLNRFAQLNDAYGRHAGDTLLKQIAQRLQASLPEPCSLARIGGDTFAIAVPHLAHGADAQAILQRIFAVLDAPFELERHDVRIAPRAGIALAPADGADAEALFKHAEAALKNAKGDSNRYLYYAPQMNQALAARLALEHELQLALDARHFVLHYQPRVDLQSGRIVSAEALIRWQHPVRGLLAPGEFIALAEETGQIAAIGDWVIEAVCEQQAAWQREQVDIVPVAVNLSAAQFKGEDLVPGVRAAVQRHGIAQHFLEFELTESMVMQDPDQTARKLAALKALGTQLSMDDFGTGYSSLAYLKRFPFDFVKIDRAFVIDVTTNPGDAAITTAIIAMAHSLNLKVVAEGVETEGQLQFLRRLRCDEIQGYYFSRPVPAAQFADLLREDRRLAVPPEPAQQPSTLLIVDDEPNNQSALKRLLRREGYRVLTASSGEEGLELLSVNAVQVIISDQRMPGMSGSEFLGKVKELYPETIRIILSGYTDLSAVTESVNRGAVFKFLTKPWDDDLLRENIRDAFRRHRP